MGLLALRRHDPGFRSLWVSGPPQAKRVKHKALARRGFLRRAAFALGALAAGRFASCNLFGFVL